MKTEIQPVESKKELRLRMKAVADAQNVSISAGFSRSLKACLTNYSYRRTLAVDYGKEGSNPDDDKNVKDAKELLQYVLAKTPVGKVAELLIAFECRGVESENLVYEAIEALRKADKMLRRY